MFVCIIRIIDKLVQNKFAEFSVSIFCHYLLFFILRQSFNVRICGFICLFTRLTLLICKSSRCFFIKYYFLVVWYCVLTLFFFFWSTSYNLATFSESAIVCIYATVDSSFWCPINCLTNSISPESRHNSVIKWCRKEWVVNSVCWFFFSHNKVCWGPGAKARLLLWVLVPGTSRRPRPLAPLPAVRSRLSTCRRAASPGVSTATALLASAPQLDGWQHLK